MNYASFFQNIKAVNSLEVPAGHSSNVPLGLTAQHQSIVFSHRSASRGKKHMNKPFNVVFFVQNPPPAAQTGIITPPHSWQGKVENVRGGGWGGWWSWKSFCFLCDGVWRHRLLWQSSFTSVSLFPLEIFLWEMIGTSSVPAYSPFSLLLHVPMQPACWMSIMQHCYCIDGPVSKWSEDVPAHAKPYFQRLGLRVWRACWFKVTNELQLWE